MRAAVGNDFDVYLTTYSGEDLANADVLPTLVITDPDGTVVSHGAVTNLSAGLYTAKVTARTTPTQLTAKWTYAVASYTQQVEYPIFVDGRFLFDIASLRKQEGLADSGRFSLSDLEQARDEVTTFFNDFTQVAFAETYKRETFDGDNRSHRFLNYTPARRLLSVTVNGVVKDFSTWTVSQFGLIRSTTTWTGFSTKGQNVIISYTYGYPDVPADVRRAALKLATNWLLTNEGSIPDRARMMTTTWATFQLSTASEDYPTGIPEVDATLRRYRTWIPSFA